MELSKFNPFPLNIKPKIDSWEKLQLLQHIDPQLKLTAAELNRILAALQYLYSNVSVSEYVSNVPVQMRGLAVNFKASGSQLQKVANAINSMPNYVINDGNLIFFYTQRIVNSSISDIKLSLTAVHGVKSYSVITEYYILSRRIPTIGGIASVGIDGTPVSEADLIPLPPRDTRSVPPQEYYLGEIGTAEVSEVVNEGSLLATPRGYTVIFRAKRSGEEVIYLYEGLEAEVGDGAEATSEADFREFPSDEAELDPSPPPSLYLFKDYETIPDMIADIGNQTASDILFVVDASDDPDLDFTGIAKKHAYYRRNYDETDADLDSYYLISAPYASNGGGGSASQENQLSLIQKYETIGTEIGDTQKDYNEKNEAIIAALVGNVPHPNYTPPTVSMTTPSALQKVGASYNVNLTLTYNQNDGGGITSQKIEKNGTQVSSTNTFSETLNVPIGLTTYKGTVNYAQGPVKDNSIGIPDPVGRIPAGSKSTTKNIEGVYPLFATTSSITVATEQPLVSMQNANNIVLNLVGESGGNKQFFDIPQEWLDNRPLTKIEFFDFNTNAWNSQNQLNTFTAVANTHVVNGNTVNYKRYTNSGSNRGAIRMRLIF